MDVDNISIEINEKELNVGHNYEIGCSMQCQDDASLSKKYPSLGI